MTCTQVNSLGDMESEFSPLIHRFPERRKNICQRIPKELAVTSVVVGLVLSVVVIAKTSSDKPVVNVAQGSPYKIDENSLDDTLQKKKENVEDLLKMGENEIKKGCPLRPMKPSAEVIAMMQTFYDCATLAEQIRKAYGTCIDDSFLPKECKPRLKQQCLLSSNKYRTYDGSCNNPVHPQWGKSNTPYVRMIAPAYADGISSLRTAKSGNPLPLARYLSQKLYSTKLKPDTDVSTLILIFGLFVDHDMIETALNFKTNPHPCCDKNAAVEDKKECLQIDIPPGDPFYGPRNVTCINLSRSLPVNGDCIGRREQLNQATAFIDASTIYGSVPDNAKPLRSYERGQLRTQMINGAPFPINGNFTGIDCGGYRCFASGDRRANMLAELTSMHVLWYREHNRLALTLHALNPDWDDEKLFQEARRIVAAQIQHITYNEMLRIILGDEGMEYFGLNIDKDEPYDGYDETVNPSVYNVMSAAALRFGHSFIQENIKLTGPDNKGTKLTLHYTFFNLTLLYHKGLDWILRGAAQQRVHSVDRFITKDARTKLFPFTGKDYGYDLAVMGILRSRDHGIPSYTHWRRACGLTEVKKWDDLYDIMDPFRVEQLKEAYEVVEDVDFIPGALAEHHVKGAMIGPTHLCLIGRQFKKTRIGDRFWFENQNIPKSFTKDQLDELYKSSLGKVICDNSDAMDAIQRQPFLVPSKKNPIVRCEEIPGIDLSKWKE